MEIKLNTNNLKGRQSRSQFSEIGFAAKGLITKPSNKFNQQKRYNTSTSGQTLIKPNSAQSNEKLHMPKGSNSVKPTGQITRSLGKAVRGRESRDRLSQKIDTAKPTLSLFLVLRVFNNILRQLPKTTKKTTLSSPETRDLFPTPTERSKTPIAIQGKAPEDISKVNISLQANTVANSNIITANSRLSREGGKEENPSVKSPMVIRTTIPSEKPTQRRDRIKTFQGLVLSKDSLPSASRPKGKLSRKDRKLIYYRLRGLKGFNKTFNNPITRVGYVNMSAISDLNSKYNEYQLQFKAKQNLKRIYGNLTESHIKLYNSKRKLLLFKRNSSTSSVSKSLSALPTNYQNTSPEGISKADTAAHLANVLRINKKLDNSFLSILERRLDVVVFKLGFARSVQEAKYLIETNQIKVNSNFIKNPNHLVELGSKIQSIS